MSTQTLKNQELVDLTNGLFAVKDLKGVKFALVVSKNMENLQNELKHLDDAGRPSEEFIKVAEQVQALMKGGKEDEAKKMEEDDNHLQDERQKQIDELQELLAEESTVQIYTVFSSQLPNDITADQIMKINKIIIDN